MKKMTKFNQQAQHGFTLIEVLITMAIVGILAAIAIPSYTQYVLRANRADAKTALLAVAQRLEQNYTLNGRYDRDQAGNNIDNTTLTTWRLNQVPAGGAARYNIAFVNTAPAVWPSQTAFTLSATPTGAQAADTTCGTLTIDNRNLKSANGQSNRSQITIDCWDK